MKIKVVNGNDIRLWRYNDKYNLNDLYSFISSTWDIIPVVGQYIIQYKDDENDLMTIDKTIDLNDAIQYAISQNKKSLKVYVRCINTNKKETDLILQPSKCDSFTEMTLDFLNNKEISRLLCELFDILISKIIGSNIEYKKYKKYIKLRKIKMPIQSIKNKMKWDGFTDNEIDIFVENKFEKKQKTMQKYAKYIKLKKLKMPKNAIINKMKLDGFTQSEINLFFEKIEINCKLLSIEEIINIIYKIFQYSQSKYDLIINHKLYIQYNNIIVAYIAEKIYNFQLIYKHFKFNTLQKWFEKLLNILYKNIFENKNNLNDFNSIKHFFENNLLFQFPLETDYGKSIHFGIKCIECNDYPIIGQRYKCTICKDVNLCCKCEKNHNAQHPLIQFKKSSKVTNIIICNDDNKYNDEGDSNNGIECICGAEMEKKVAKVAYNWTNIVYCDICNKKYFNEMVYHCPKDKNVVHSQGYDLCIDCVSVKYGQKVKDLLI